MSYSKLTEADMMSTSKDLLKLYENNGYGQAVNDLWDLMKEMNVDPIIKSEIFGKMVTNHARMSMPTDRNLYDNLKSKINEIQK